MKRAQLDGLVETVLYAGHLLHPSRPSARRNGRCVTAGRVYPAIFTDGEPSAARSVMSTQCLVLPRSDEAGVEICARFLQPLSREIGVLAEPLVAWPERVEPVLDFVPLFELEGSLYQSWSEATEREVRTEIPLLDESSSLAFDFPASRTVEPIRDRAGNYCGAIVRHQPELHGLLEIAFEPLDGGLTRLTLRVINRSPVPTDRARDAETVLPWTFAATHATLHAHEAAFVSLTDPPAEFADAARACENTGVWPVLVGDEHLGERDTLLASPIMLADYPALASDGADDHFTDSDRDDFIPARTRAMADAASRDRSPLDSSAHPVPDRAAALSGDQHAGMCGAIRVPHSVSGETFHDHWRLAEAALGDGKKVRAGDRVRLHPRARAELPDRARDGQTAVIEAVEQNEEGRVQLAVIFEDDPGHDLGAHRQFGPRCLYDIDEIEPLKKETLV